MSFTHLPKPTHAIYWLFIFPVYLLNISIVLYSNTFLSQILSEKDKLMKPLLKMMGITDFQYFGSWTLVHCGEGLLTAAIYSVGLVAFQAFRNTNILALFVLLYADMVAHTCLMVLFSTVLWNPESGIIIATTFSVILCAPFLLFVGQQQFPGILIFLFSLLSPAAFCCSALNMLIQDQSAEKVGKG
jgi:hypothetical protein